MTTFFSPLWAFGLSHMAYALPLIVAISLVYSATRHELMSNILKHAVRVGLWIGLFMGLIFAALQFMSARL